MKTQTRSVFYRNTCVMVMLTLALTNVVATRALAQGRVFFDNHGLGYNTHIYGSEPGSPLLSLSGNTSAETPAGTQVYTGAPLAGTNWFAQLFSANGSNQSESLLEADYPITGFGTGAAAGHLVLPADPAGVAILSNVPPDAPVATLQLRVWDNSSGLYPDWNHAQVAWHSGLVAAGKSPAFDQQNIGGNTYTPPLPTNLVSFNVYFQNSTNQPPVAFSQSLTATQGSSIFITLTASDPDGDSLTYRIVSPPSLGYGYLTGAPPNVLYVSTTNFSTEVTDSFMFVANDGLADSAAATISITLYPPSESSNTLPVLSLVSNDAIASEALNSDGTTNTATFSIQRTASLTNDVSINFSVHGSATYGSDYYTVPALLGLFSNSTTTVFLPAGATSIVYTLYPIPDNLTEGTEFAIFTINTNSSYALGLPSQITVSILDSNPPPVPSTRVIFPPDGAVYASTLDIKLRVANSNVANLKLYGDNQLLTSFTSAPTIVTFVTNFSVGSHTVYSVQDNFPAGGNVTSAPVHFQILAPLTSSPLSPSLGTAPEANASFVIDSNGALFDFGDGRLGALADGSGPNQEPNNVTRPIQIPLPAGTNRFVKASSGSHHTLALTSDGSLWTCGDNSSGQTGQSKSTATFMGFVTIPEFTGWKDIAAGNAHSLALDKSGRLTVCGNNSSGQLGLGNTTNVSTFQFVPFPTNVTAWTAIGAGSNYSIALGNNGQLYACGLGLFGTLGTGGLTNSLRFVPVSSPTGITNWLKVTAGAQHVLAIAGNGALYAWGLGSLGQLGNGSFSSSPLPHLVTPPAGVSNWFTLAAGISHSLGIGNDGNLYGWGNSILGQLGPGPTARSLPTLIPAPDGVFSWKSIAAGINHSLGVGDNCTLYAWGANNFGQLGIGSTTNQTNEVTVSNLGDLCAPPTVTITYPIDGSVFPAAANILINAETTSHDGQISRIDLFENGLLLASGTNTPFSFIWSNVVQGAYTLTAAAADSINPMSFSTSAPVNIIAGSSIILPVVSVVATDAQAAEPPPTNNGTFTFTRTGNTQLPLTVLFRISGTATLNTDYQTSPPLGSGTTNSIYFRTIPTNSNSSTITVIPLADTNIEQTETVVLTLFTNSAYTLGNQNGAIVTIMNSTNSPPPPPPPVLNLVTTDSQAYEVTASGGIDTASFMVTRTGGSNFVRFPVTVSGTATYGVDYYTVPAFPVSSNSSTAIFELQSNQTSLVFTLYPIQDSLAEGTETAIFTLGTNFGYTLGPSNQSVISIFDGPAPPQLAQIIFPPDGSVFASPESINIKASATNASELRIYGDDQLLAVSNPPAATTFVLAASTNFSPGEHTVYAVGTNRLGLVSNTYTSPPVHFRVLAPLAQPMAPSIGIAPNSDASYVIDANGALFDWGNDSFGQLGDGILPPGHALTIVVLPEQIPLGDGTNRWIKVAGGADHALALDSSGRLYSTGENGSGQLGLNGPLLDQSVFVPVPFPTNVTAWKDIAAGAAHSLGLTTDGRLFAWGNNGSGQLGIPGVVNAPVPRLVPFPMGVTAWNDVAAGSSFSVALANDGNIYTCGQGGSGALGTGGTTNSTSFVPVFSPAGVTNWLKVACGFQHVLAIAGNYALYAWGPGNSGQLGNGDFTNATVPTLVSLPAGVTNWLALAGGNYHSLGIAENGDLYSWGANVTGELGPGPATRAVPTLVAPPAGVATWKAVGAGAFHSLSIADNCALYSFGANSSGQLGIGSFVQQTNLQMVHNLGDLCAEIVVAETNHAPSFVKGPDITVPEDAGIQVFTNWATQINPGAPSETNQTLTFIVVTNDNPRLFSTQPGIVPSGNLFFAGAPNSNGVAHVTVVLKDDGGTANGGQDTSAPQSFIITITPPNHPPVPVVRVFPLFVLSSNYSAFQVISPNNSNALVFFDASLSTDADGDPLAFAWFKGGTNNLFGTSVVATNVLGIGTNSIILTVNDGHTTVIDPFEVQVLSAGDAIGELIALVEDFAAHSAIKPNVWKQLIGSLQSAQSEFENGMWNAGLVHLRIFQFRVLLQIAPSDQALANSLNYIAQQIVDAVQGSAKHQPSIGSIENRGGNHKSLTFAGAPGQIYLVQASSDLLHWETIGIASETDPGAFQFNDRDNAVARFYRLILP